MLLSSIFLLVSAILPFTVASTHGHLRRNRHQELAQRARGDVNIHKRGFDNARFTFYDVGLGACGQTNSPNDFIVALNVGQYGEGYPGPQCFKSITISYGGKTAQATIMDECMGCPYAGLDFSAGLFSYFASEDAGVLYGSWWFNDGSSEPTFTSSDWTPTPAPDLSLPASTHHHHHHDAAETTSTSGTSTGSASSTTTSGASTTTTSETSSTSETSTTSETTASTTSSTSSTSSFSTSFTLYDTTDLAFPTGIVVVPIPVPVPNMDNPENLLLIGEALINLGMMVSTQHGN